MSVVFGVGTFSPAAKRRKMAIAKPSEKSTLQAILRVAFESFHTPAEGGRPPPTFRDFPFPTFGGFHSLA